MDGYEALANAIVLQAAEDYRLLARLRARNPHSERIAALLEQTGEFFLSRWYGALTAVDGAMLLRRLENECKYRKKGVRH
ncbi:MAG: hypothetical protein Q4C53_08940 [Clostridia bacterium]|nr:hypothetical protein [Clostridia bacterium]